MKKSIQPFNSKKFIKILDLLLAEVSFAYTDLSIELDWASSCNILTICVYKKDSKISESLKTVVDSSLIFVIQKNL